MCTQPATVCVPGAPLIAPLRRVLLAHALHQPQVGYCQGLNFIAAILLLHGDEATAFVLLCRLCGELLPGYHSPAMPGLHAGQRKPFRALLLSVRNIFPPLLVRYVATLDGKTIPLLLPEIRSTYLPSSDVSKFDEVTMVARLA